MKFISCMVLALAFMSAPSIYSAETPAGTFDETEQAAVEQFEATLGQEGTFQVVLKDGQMLGTVSAPGFELKPAIAVADGLNADGVHCTLLAIEAKASVVGESDISIEVLNADGSVDHVIRAHCTCVAPATK